MLVLGIDPGTRHLGWGVVRGEGNRAVHIGHGVIHASEKLSLAARLLTLDHELAQVIERYRPEVGSVESLFFHKDAQAAAKLGHARGVVLLSLQRAAVEVAEYAPARVKLALTGNGRAEKSQVAQMVKMMLNLTGLPEPDAADALALAMTHLRRAPIEARLAEAQRRSSANPALQAPRRRRASSARRLAKALGPAR